jgi:hypothetical protein
MGIDKGPHFNVRDICVDYAFEEVRFRWDHVARKIYRKFYRESESTEPVPHDNRLFKDALRFGDEITRDAYETP